MPSRLSTFDPGARRAEVEAIVRRLRLRSGPLTLVGYDANGIQQYVTRARALPYLRGASRRIKDFDGEQAKRDDCLFAAGGRGRFLIRGAVDDAATVERLASLRDAFRKATDGEVLAVACAPYDPAAEGDALALLAARLDVEKDAAPPPDHTQRGDTRFEHCPVCRRRPTRDGCFWTFGRNERLPVCAPCERIIALGKKVAGHDEERGKTLEDLSSLNRIAVVAADGNQMGALFGSLETLADATTASRAVSVLFEGALEAALDACGVHPSRRVTPVVGGDDIRLFMGPERVFDVIERLVGDLEAAADDWAPHLFPTNSEAARRFACIGLGVGVVIGPATHPASLAIAQAHALEDSAKAHGRRSGHRSSLDFIHLRSGDELISGVRGGSHPLGIGSAGGDELATARTAAAELTRVPPSQRSIVLRAMDREWHADAAEAERLRAAPEERPPRPILDPELANLLRYQVARSPAWQTWFGLRGADWTDPADVERHAPSHAVLELARLDDLRRRAEGEAP